MHLSTKAGGLNESRYVGGKDREREGDI